MAGPVALMGDGTPPTPNAESTLDPLILVEYLINVLQVTLGASPKHLETHGSLLSLVNYPDTIQRCSRFARESQVALYVQKDLVSPKETNGVDSSPEQESSRQFVYRLSSELSSSVATTASVVLIKRPQPLDPLEPLASQIQLVNLPGVASTHDGKTAHTPSIHPPIEVLHSFVHSALAPYFESFAKSQSVTNGVRTRLDGDSKTGFPAAKKKLAEFELSLLHLQQNIEIPEVQLQLHQEVLNALAEAARQGSKPSIGFISRELLDNSRFGNEIQGTVNSWINSIKAITNLSRDVSAGSAAQEINFWLSMESALEGIEAQLRSDGVQLTLDVLRQARRYQATFSFSSDTGLKDAIDKVQKYNQLMRDFPLDELLSATSLSKLHDGLGSIFNHLNKKLKLCPYPVSRALQLVEALSDDLDAKLRALLNGRSLMHLDYREFETSMKLEDHIWKAWDEHIKVFTNTARETVRKRNEKFIPIKIIPRHAKTHERILYLTTFRRNHEQLQQTIINVFNPMIATDLENGPEADGTLLGDFGDIDAAHEVAQAYSALWEVDVLDSSPEGTRLWIQAEMTYNERTTRVENAIIACLRDRLATAKNANEMFRVFSKFNALLIRPKIRGAIAEYQTQLIDNVKRDIAHLHDRYKTQYGHTEAHAMAQLRDIPPVSGAMIWVKQIERQLDGYLKKMENVLGDGWANHSEGEKLYGESQMFRKKLDSRPIFDAWLQDVNRRNVAITGPLFIVSRNRSAANLLELSVNFDSHVIALFKEIRNLVCLNYPIPHSISTVARQAKRVYPFAVKLMETSRTFAQITRQISEMPEVSTLLAGYQQAVHSLIARGIPLRWETFVDAYEVPFGTPTSRRKVAVERPQPSKSAPSRHVDFVRLLATAVSTLQNKVDALATINQDVQKVKAELATCEYTAEGFQRRLDVMQKAVDQLNIGGYTNIAFWVDKLNLEVESILRSRLQHAIQLWIDKFQHGRDADLTKLSPRKRRDVAQLEENTLDAGPHFDQLLHEMSIREQVICLDPPIEHARAAWLFHFHEWLEIVCNLPKVMASRYEMQFPMLEGKGHEHRFSSLPLQCAGSLVQAYHVLEDRVSELVSYVDKWLQFQSLWDLQSEQVLATLGEDLSDWLQMLQEIRETRRTFDTTEVNRDFGYLSIDYEQVQTKVNAKYDQWQHEVLVQFAGRLGNRMKEVHTELDRERRHLEGESLEASSTAHAVTFITAVQQCQRKVTALAPEMNVFEQGQKALSRQRYQFPQEWMYYEQLDHEWATLNEILARKQKLVQDQSDALRAKISAEDAILNQKIGDVVAQWGQEKPVSGTIDPDAALNLLSSFQSQLVRLQEQSEMVAKAGEALELPVNQPDVLSAILEEVADFQSVWAALSTIWKGLNDLRETLWNAVQPRKLRQSLDNLLKMTKDMPSRMRQYAAFEHVQGVLRQLLKTNPLLSDMKSEAVRERHWVKIFKTLKPSKRYSSVSMTLGDVWDLNLQAGEKIIRDVIVQAQGEMALEEFLRQVRDTWTNYTLDLVAYQGKCRLIRGWDELREKCSENLNSLQAMKHSPYYKEFEEEASTWEDKLNRVHVLFDVWIDVQRQWVYLEGVFTGNADIKHLLPNESARFQGINTEFFSVMKKVYRAPYVLEVLNIAGVQKSLERLAELLQKIQKALGEYLEQQRVMFPRFYFVGDEDLLEIIGNSNDVLRVTKHFKKMFAGVSGLLIEEESDIVGISSRDGEEVRLKKPISLIRTPKINEWLSLLVESMRSTLAELLAEAVEEFENIFGADEIASDVFNAYLMKYPTQIAVLATQVVWTSAVDDSLQNDGEHLDRLHGQEVKILELLAGFVLQDLRPIERRKCEHLITECVHQRDVIAKLLKLNVSTPTHYHWLVQMRYVYRAEGNFMDRLRVKMANADLEYGFEYLGAPERLVRTPLTDRCFLTLTQALCQGLGGSPYGPAGTGKTESVKALGLQLGKFTLVFCCDDTFDFQAMGRIFLGICQVGAWGCFDEFNRLEERILSAVSQQVQNIQDGLRKVRTDEKTQIDLAGRQLRVNSNTGIFITMNPGYAGRSNLPDNLKKLFRSVAMSKPDKELIAEVMLFSQGFSQARQISKRAVPFFDLCSNRLSKQSHYDFGLRALKSVLVSSGGLKRGRITTTQVDTVALEHDEPQIVVQSLRETMAPKLVKADAEILVTIEKECFPEVTYVPAALENLRAAIREVAAEQNLVVTETWMTKVIQLYQIQTIHHGVMMVGASGSGKSSAWKVLLQALQRLEKIESVYHIIDSKVMSKEALYGTLDSTTREWTDGLFTSILRKVVDNLRGELNKRHWIVFDGDVDPVWVENLNSVLDDNKLLTLPNGERLNLPSNMRIMFEVETLKYATLATVSRCGMVWFSDDTVTADMMMANYLKSLRSNPFDDLDDDEMATGSASSTNLDLQNRMADLLQRHLGENGILPKLLTEAAQYDHIMQFTEGRLLNTLFSLLNRICRSMMEYNLQHVDFPLGSDQVEGYVSKKLLLALVWSFTGDCPLGTRKSFGNSISGLLTVDGPVGAQSASLIDYDVALPLAEWVPWQSRVPHVEVNTHSVTETDVVIPTLDTVRHEEILYSWLAEHKPLLLCGPPGSGKTMTLFSALRKLPDMEVVGLNFSSATTPDLLIKTFEQYCEYRRTVTGVIMSPTQIGRWLVLFCDEINLPAPDKYGTQRVISFIRQLVEHNGFWRTSDKTWVTLERIQFVGACNPPTDAGRTPMGTRFLRHAPLVMVDYPGELSLLQIYGTFNNAVLKIVPSLKGYAEPLTKAMVQFYLESQSRFTTDIQAHYIYSPRELTRWVRGVYEAIRPLENLSVEGLVRIWAHEALRLFHDRLIQDDERKWTEMAARRIALEHFPTIDEIKALDGPLLFSNWLSKNYIPVEREQLRSFVKARLKTFCEEEIDVPLVLFDDVLDNVLRIDRVFRQPQGHLILIGVSGSGKTTLSRFVAWMNGLKVYQIKIHGRYSAADFDDDLRDVLRRCGCKGEKICFIMDESNVLDSAFLERMNTLLANAEVPGLFEGDEFAALMTACREGAQRQGLLLDSQEELYKWFTQQIVKNLHVVFTMNPPEGDLSSRAATSPALFNRCVLNWFGDWSSQALFQIGLELTHAIDLDQPKFTSPESLPLAYVGLRLPATYRETVINAMVYVHYSLHGFNRALKKQQNLSTYLTPRHFLDFIAQFVKLYNEKREDLEEQQRHLNIGLEKLRATVDKVRDLRASLAEKNDQLKRKDAEGNEKLARMVADQQEAEQRKATSLEIQGALETQEQEVSRRKEVVLNDLARAEPAVLEAQRSVSNIKRQHLTEVRSMGSPPAGVKLALEAVCTLLGHKVDSWKTIQGIIRRDDFIASIVNYDNEKQMTRNHRLKMRNDFLSKEEFTFERVNRASKACGPLVSWVEAQVGYSEILERVGPLRDEVAELEDQALQTKAEAQAVQNTVKKLEQSIANYKTEYAALVSESQLIKTEMSRVQSKVDRSLRLLDSLSSERSRWADGSKLFDAQLRTLVGDVLVAAAFLAYGGLYDQQLRKAMKDDWFNHLTLSGIEYKPLNPTAEYLSTADERLEWQEHSLPVDDLCTENAVILSRFNRYPLIIDPSGRTTEFLQKQSKERRLTVTSFLDDSFVKQLESSLRFGNPILIQDAEHFDPILNHVLNKEYQKTGGRVLIQLGKQEIDFSPAFKLFLSTRDPTAHFAPDICSRTTFVNFTVTQSSLQSQSLNDVLKSERPDVDERRTNLIKLQGEFAVNLRHLERRLLQALNESRGNILDDDALIESLELLKKEAAAISDKMAETAGVMAEVETMTLEYTVVAKSCSAIFAVLGQLHHLNHFYHFSLRYFTEIFHSVLHQNPQLAAERNHNSRIKIIVRSLFVRAYQRTALALLQKDRVTLAVLLAQAAPYPLDARLVELVLSDDIPGIDVSTEPDRQDESMAVLTKLPGLQNAVLDAVDPAAWDRFWAEEAAEEFVPNISADGTSEVDRGLVSLLLLKLFRMDRFVPAAEKFVSTVFGSDLNIGQGELRETVHQVASGTPIALCSSPGFDASYKVDQLVEASHVRCSSIAMGSNEGPSSADKAISSAAAVGSWVLVKNVHLAPTWLQSLEKRLNALKPDPDFRLFLSMETSSKAPSNLLRASRVLMYEQPAGIRANMQDSLSSLSTRAMREPVERTRLYLLLSFLHAVVQERLRYAPTLGWKGFWEFNESDYECSAFIIDAWVDSVGHGRTNVAPQKLPWDVIRVLIAESYGGKIDDEEDFKILQELVAKVMTPAAYDQDYQLVEAKSGTLDSTGTGTGTGTEGLTAPGGTGMRDFMEWVQRLPEREPPTYLGLPANADKVLLVGQAQSTIRNLQYMVGLLEDAEPVIAEVVEGG
ncbi:MAG: Dynein heavy chain, cytoplasmic [Watsoniomyces obsoletus]|nr:MAG: Dynein heavy chain, cytoplasmic [Watsoniomyces obsoletus]